MFCGNCGEGPFEGKFCPKCGTPSSQPSAGAPTPSGQAQPDIKDTMAKAGTAAKSAAAGIGAVVAGAAGAVADKASNAVETAKNNQQQRIANYASGASFDSAVGFGGAGGGLGSYGAANAVTTNMSSAVRGDANFARDVQKHFFYNIKRNRRYFTTPHPLRAIILLIFSIISFFVTIPACTQQSHYGSGPGFLPVVVSLCLFIAACAWLWYLYGYRPTDQEVDAMYAGISKNGADEAAMKSDLDEDERTIVEPMIFSGPTRENVPATSFSHLGKDGITRWSNFQMSTVFCTEHQLFYYSVSQSLTIERREITTIDVYYRDIALVEMREFLGGYGRMTVHTNSGESFTVAYNHEQEDSVRGLRALLREKKAHVVVELAQ